MPGFTRNVFKRLPNISESLLRKLECFSMSLIGFLNKVNIFR